MLGPSGWTPGAGQWRGDGWENHITGFGTHLDKTMATEYRLNHWLSDTALDQLFHGDDITERLITTVPKELLRKGYCLCFDDKMDQDTEAAVLDSLDELEANTRVVEAMWWARLFGDGAVVIGADDGRPASLPLVPELVKQIDWLEAIDRRYYAINTYYTSGPKYGKPETYALGNPGAIVSPIHIVHESRLIRFHGAPTSIAMMRARGGYNISNLQRSYEVIRSFATGFKAVEVLLTDGPQGVYKIKNLASLLGSNNKGLFESRLQTVDMFRSALRAIVIDADGEGFERQSFSFSGVPDVMDRFCQRLAASVPMPVTKLMGISPGGLNATGESDTRNWYDGLETDQVNDVRKPLRRLIQILCATREGPTRGLQPKKIAITFNKLWTLDPLQESMRRLNIAQTDNIYVNDIGSLTADEQALNRFGERGYDGESYKVDRELRETLVERDKKTSLVEPEPSPSKEELAPDAVTAIVTVNQGLAALGLEPDEDETVGEMKIGELIAKQAGTTEPGAHATDPAENRPNGFDVQDPAEVAKQEAEAKALNAPPANPNSAGAQGPARAPTKAGPPKPVRPT